MNRYFFAKKSRKKRTLTECTKRLKGKCSTCTKVEKMKGRIFWRVYKNTFFLHDKANEAIGLQNKKQMNKEENENDEKDH